MGNKKKKMGPLNSKLFILHGWAYSIEKWKPFLNLLDQDGVEYEMLKIPGLTTALKRVWTINDYVEWLNNQISSMQYPISILGHSNGGRIAAAFAAKYPSKVSHLILIDCAGIIHKNFLISFKRAMFWTVAKVGKKITKSDSIRNLLYRVVGEQDYNKASPILKKTMINLISNNLTEALKKIKVPTLIIWGQNDKITPLSDGRKISELISGSKFKIIKNAGHSPQLSNPKEIFEIIKLNL